MPIDFLLDRFEENRDRDAIVWLDKTYSYDFLLSAIQKWTSRLEAEGVESGSVVALEGDFSPNAVALLISLIRRRCIVVPLTESLEVNKSEFRQVAQVEVVISVDRADNISFTKTSNCVDHELLQKLKNSGRPGLVIFSSGSTGKSKAVLHDFVDFLEKFQIPRRSQRMITFLLFDHIGGMNTLFQILSNAGCVITVQGRSPDEICSTIAKHKVEILPTSPTFINLMLLSEAYLHHDLSSLKMVSYGSEEMPANTLKRFREIFPEIRLLQIYGLSELGILHSKSKSSDSLWVKFEGDGFETRVTDGLLEVKANSTMLGYLNAADPFTPDGWLKTGDAVEVDGEYVRILGRKSQMINVGGEKVYPAEIENVLQLMDGVEYVAAKGEPNPIVGQMVTVRVKVNTGESVGDFRKRMRAFCKDKLVSYKIPQKVVLVDKAMHGERFKKMR